MRKAHPGFSHKEFQIPSTALDVKIDAGMHRAREGILTLGDDAQRTGASNHRI